MVFKALSFLRFIHGLFFVWWRNIGSNICMTQDFHWQNSNFKIPKQDSVFQNLRQICFSKLSKKQIYFCKTHKNT